MNESTLVPRKDESDLDWLARNVHEWPYELQTRCYVMTGSGGKKEISASAYSPFFSKFTKDQWLARRAELQNKPSWDDAPEWAMWLAQDEDGELFWYERKPSCGECLFYHAGGDVKYISCVEVLGDWRDTLEKRPDMHKSHEKIDTSAERVQKAKKSMHIDPAISKQPAPKGSGNPILGMVLADLTNRALEGKEKYGEPLLAHNGRNPLWDAYQEALDLAMYLRQAIEEQK